MPFPAHRVLRRPQATSLAPAQVTRWRGAWLVIGAAEARAALADPRLRPTTPAAPPEQPPPDPAQAREHAGLRRFAARVLTARHVERARPRTTSTAKALLDLMANGGEPVDLVAGVARRLAVATACQVLGVPERDRAELRELVGELHAGGAERVAVRGGAAKAGLAEAGQGWAEIARAELDLPGPTPADRAQAAPTGGVPSWAAAARAEWALEDRPAGDHATNGRIAWDAVVRGADDTERAALLPTARDRGRPPLKRLTLAPSEPRRRGSAARADTDLHRYFAALARRRRSTPEGDLISTLATASVDGHRLADDELADLGALLLTSAHGTTTHRIAATAHTLLTHPADLAWLRHNPESLPEALDALPPPTRRPRGPALAEADVELGGVVIRAGERVHVSDLATGPTPTPRPAPSWVGARLARMDLEVTIGALLPRFPGLRLAVDADQVQWRHGAPESLPVAWS
ncbi:MULTISPECIES: hypothetical protein [Actinosynnema]|uniref:hypothetical protein n=1 Tax=Actinosynnema TaxID=40566 RepID=UPI0020A43EF7|nr:hypothetical protein [Actinosynnema pretiosum]MCP2092582.1 hypothetical protein [Actinosynnema pretiosum]